ncbi:hypothetical protein [Pelagibaculum spongiae]|uniref:Uncharacterized protein n=1 Tax=Pelagibaculum spongiae TaxID=2080658 RepID=A0A2V1GPH0_9GAMM|nr:hypothetical protein [Pelagibaculum spongiae]PVZ64527.1 hypothetical protein DC094_19645 [Pelagibaculum spongiae]
MIYWITDQPQAMLANKDIQLLSATQAISCKVEEHALIVVAIKQPNEQLASWAQRQKQGTLLWLTPSWEDMSKTPAMISERVGVKNLVNLFDVLFHQKGLITLDRGEFEHDLEEFPVIKVVTDPLNTAADETCKMAYHIQKYTEMTMDEFETNALAIKKQHPSATIKFLIGKNIREDILLQFF